MSLDIISLAIAKKNASPTLIEKNITANGTYTASDDSADGYSSVSVDVPNTYTQADEGKVVSNGALVAQTAMSTEITSNDTYDTTLYNSVTVNVPQGGGGESVAKKDVNFYDYDGTVVASYTASEFAELTAMPANPTHEGLTAQGWNWTLSEAKTYVSTYGKLNIGQMYITSDGKTRLYIRLSEDRLKPYLGLKGNSSGTTVSIDWGDNSAEESVTLNNTTVYTSHEYATAVEYVIAITVTTGSITFIGNNAYGSSIFRKSATPNTNFDRVYHNILTRLEIGSRVTSIGNNAFSNCCSLASITIPNGVTSIGNNAFQNCYSLASITIPNGVTSIGNNAFSNCCSLVSITIPKEVTSIGDYGFYYCYSLASITIPKEATSIGEYGFYYCYSLASITIPKEATSIGEYAFSNCCSLASITIPNGVTSIDRYTFQNCYSLASITIPNGVTSIGVNGFHSCYGLGFIKFEGSTPATASSGAFSNIPTDCIIYVPTGSLSVYTSASNYPSSSTYTYVEY